MKIGIIGIGFVGGALLKSFTKLNIEPVCYDKYKKEYNKIDMIIKTDIIFLCLPTLLKEDNNYDIEPIKENLLYLSKNNYKGIIAIKSTITPETIDNFSEIYENLKICHNPEFLTARTAFEDFHNQQHIIIGNGLNMNNKDIDKIELFYRKNYPEANISICNSKESESMKLFSNSFYASKVILFNEYYLLCKKNNTDFGKVKELMLKNNWINPMHTNVPGLNNELGFGGACFPKDTKALYKYMDDKNSDCDVLGSVIRENTNIRKFK